MTNLNLFSLYDIVKNKENAIRFLQDAGILNRYKLCQNNHEMVLTITDKRERWRCGKGNCRNDISLKSGSWLENTNLTYTEVVLFIYCWSFELTSINFCQRELSILSNATIVDWNNYLREVCANSLLQNPLVIGGPGLHVEIDESLFTKRKNNVGRIHPQQWVFGGICRETKECFLYNVPDRSATTLIPIIIQSIRPGSIIISDEWRAYNQISNLGLNYVHERVNHSISFINPVTGANTQLIEGCWNLAKQRNKRQFGTHRGMLDSHLCEYMWRRRLNGTNPFEKILNDIYEYWPPM